MGEFPPHSRPNLRYFLGRAEPVQPRHQRRMQARGDCVRRGGNCRRNLHRFQLAPGLQYCLCHLLHEQGDSVGTLDNVLSDLRRKRLVADDAIDQAADVAMSQPVERKSCDVRLPGPGRLELGPERHDQQRG